MRNGMLLATLPGLVVLSWVVSAPTLQSQGAPAPTVEQTAALGDFYILRTIRETSAAPTAFCSEERVGFGEVRIEDRYSLNSTATRSADGLMTHSDVASAGTLRACFGRTADSATSSFYGEFASVRWYSKLSVNVESQKRTTPKKV